MARRKSEKIIEENNVAKITIDEQLDAVEGYKEFIHHEVVAEEPTEEAEE